MKLSVMGAGAFGTSMAISLAHKQPVTLWARNTNHAAEMHAKGENTRRLPEARFPQNLTVTDNFIEAAKADVLLLAVPMQSLRDFLEQYRSSLDGKILVACCKGMEIGTGIGPVAVIKQTLTQAKAAILTGPSFAADIARGLPTALTLACGEERIGKQLQCRLSTDNIRLYRTCDVAGAELGGAMKNVIAIACGAVIGAGFGESARAALMTRGYAEVKRLALIKQAHPETLSGLSGFGDLTLTCCSELSRNYRLGLSLGRGESFDPSITVEGAATARAVARYAAENQLEMPITQTVTNLLDHSLTIHEAADQLLTRPLKEE